MSLHSSLKFGATLVCALALTACGGGGSSNVHREPPPAPTPGGGSTGSSSDIVRKSDDFEWQDCTLPQGLKQGAQCTVVEVPLNWDEPEGQQIDVAVVRYLASGTPVGDIWTLDGGPTYWGRSYANAWAQRFISDRDIYIPILRGTGLRVFYIVLFPWRLTHNSVLTICICSTAMI